MTVAQRPHNEIRPGVVIGSPFSSHEAAHLGLQDKVDALMASHEFPMGLLHVRGDLAIVSPIPGSGGEEPIMEIQSSHSGYVLVVLDDSIPYELRN